jgi:ABC-type spermidine/putrescine transport system permease subunit II
MKSTNNSPVPSRPGRSTKCLGAKYGALAEEIILPKLLANSVLIALVTTSLANFLALVAIVAKHLFPRPK